MQKGVKICIGAHHVLLCLQSGCVPGTLLRKVLQIRIPNQDVLSGWGCRLGTCCRLGMQIGVANQEPLEEYTSY